MKRFKGLEHMFQNRAVVNVLCRFMNNHTKNPWEFETVESNYKYYIIVKCRESGKLIGYI